MANPESKPTEAMRDILIRISEMTRRSARIEALAHHEPDVLELQFRLDNIASFVRHILDAGHGN